MRALALGMLATTLLTGCLQSPLAPASRADSNRPYDGGGALIKYLREAHAARGARAYVPIRGDCISSCALKLAAGPGVCVAHDARVGVHEARELKWLLAQFIPAEFDWYPYGSRNEHFTQIFRDSLPACARDLFVSRGGFESGEIVSATGSEILAACPQIRACR